MMRQRQAAEGVIFLLADQHQTLCLARKVSVDWVWNIQEGERRPESTLKED
jgi:hypothetical protein